MTVAHVLPYLAQLEAHNDRAWYAAHKAERLAAAAEFEALAEELQHAVGAFVPGVLEYPVTALTFKLQRDLRFSPDKSPYNPCFRVHFGPAGKVFIPMGPYLAVRPGNRSFLGGGLFAALPEATRLVRDAITADPEAWTRLAAALPWPVLGETLKHPPRGYPADHPCVEHLKMKSWYLQVPVADEEFEDPGFAARAVSAFEAMHPLDQFLNHALRDLKMPRH